MGEGQSYTHSVRHLTQQKEDCVVMNNKSILVLVVSALMLTIAGCNTTAGIGRDMSSVGNAVEDTAEDAKD